MAEIPMSLLAASPSSLHFSGFQLDQSYQQRISVRNNSAKSLRLQFSFPKASSPFRVAFASTNRKQFVPPGLTEDIVVTFRAPASGFQYYYDCVRVRCEQVAYASNAPVTLAGELLIPLHAYPVANTVRDFPNRIDFGAVPIGQVVRREIPLACSVPIEFEFAVELVKPHASFTVFPLSGIIPANGTAKVEIEFRPLAYMTASAELQLMVSQLGFEPVICMLVGSSSSTAGEGKTPTNAEDSRAESKARDKDNKGGASLTVKSPKRTVSGNSAKSSSKSSTPKDEEVSMEIVNGVEIPNDLNSVGAVTFVLNQQAGKLRPRDLKKAITASRELRAQQENDVAAGDNNIEERADSLSFAALVQHEIDNQKQLAEDDGAQLAIGKMRFQREAESVEALEKALEFQDRQRIGSRLLSKDQQALLKEIRSINALGRARDARERMRNNFDTIAYGLSDAKTAKSGVRTASLPVEIASMTNTNPALLPDFKPHKNDMWARRARVLQRLIRAVSTVMVQYRAQRRLDTLKKWIGPGATQAQIRERVALDWKQYNRGNNQLDQEHSNESGDGTSEQLLYLPGFPEVDGSSFRTRQRSPVSITDMSTEFKKYAPPGFSAFFPLRERDEALVMGHTPIPLPPLPTYVPLYEVEDAEATDTPTPEQRGVRQVRKLRAGALDEYSCSIRCLSEPPKTVESEIMPANLSPMPSVLEMLPPDVFLRPQASVRPLVLTDQDPSVSLLGLRPRESDPGFALRPTLNIPEPEVRTLRDRMAKQVGMASVAAERRLRRLTTPSSEPTGDGVVDGSTSLFISESWRPQTTAKLAGTGIDPLFMPTDPAKASFGPSLFNSVWYVGIGNTNYGIPAFATCPEDIPLLSDSESDEEDNDGKESDGHENKTGKRRVPTWEDALRLFEPDAEQPEGGKEEKSQSPKFERFRHLEEQERAYCKTRRELLDRLPNVRSRHIALQKCPRRVFEN